MNICFFCGKLFLENRHLDKDGIIQTGEIPKINGKSVCSLKCRRQCADIPQQVEMELTYTQGGP